MGDSANKAALYEQFARVGKALASGKRLELLDLLAQSERSVDALARAAGLGVTSASAHLQILRQANLVSTRRDGTRVLYRLAGPDVADLLRAASHGRPHPPARCADGPGHLPRSTRSTPSRSAATSCSAVPRQATSPFSTFDPRRSTPPATFPARSASPSRSSPTGSPNYP